MNKGQQVIIIGNIMEKTITDNIDEIEKHNNQNIVRSDGFGGFYHLNAPTPMDERESPEIIENEVFKEYTEIARSCKISKDLKAGGSIFLHSDNKNYRIEKVSTDIEGNIIYFIDKVVKVITEENIVDKINKAQKRISKWIKQEEERKYKERETRAKVNMELQENIFEDSDYWHKKKKKWGLFGC